ncbi:hypothetical protein EUTSA_v10017971mg, partial [Eutrema salsugineum]
MRNTELIFIPTPTDVRIHITILLMNLQGQSHLDTYVNSIASSQPFVRFIDVPELEEKPYTWYYSVCGSLFTVKGIVADFFCLPIIDVAKDVSLSFYVFLSTNSGFLAMMQYLADRHSRDISVFVRKSEEMVSIPGFVTLYDAYVKLAILFTKANGILVNSSFDIEPTSAQPHPDQDLAHGDEYMKWLDDQPEAWVVFLCFGSMGRLRGPLLKEVALGLEL